MRNIMVINEVIDVLVDRVRTLVPVPCTHGWSSSADCRQRSCLHLS